MLEKIAGKPVIEHVVARSGMCKKVDQVWLATTTSKADDVLYDWAKNNNVLSYRGSEEDVLDRYYQTALGASADLVVRVTGDCPFIDPEVAL